MPQSNRSSPRVGFLNRRRNSTISDTKILSPKQLNGIENHQYASEGNTLLDPIMQVFWNWVVGLVPFWVAPNMITIVGLILNAIGGVLLCVYFPGAYSEESEEEDEDRPTRSLRYLFLLKAITLFLYQTLDAIDGKQARRTNSSSPLGELFDHGMDSISTALVGISLMIAINAGHEPHLMLIFLVFISTAFYLAHWSTFITGKLEFSFIDVTEAQFMSIGMLLVSFIFGPEIWDTFIPFSKFPIRYVIYLSLLTNFCSRMKEHLDRVIAGGAGPNGSTVAGSSVLGPIQPLLFLYFLVLLIYIGDSSIMHNYPVAFGMTVMLCFSKVSNKLIVAHMSKTGMNNFDSIYFGLFMVLLNVYLKELVSNEWMVFGRGWVFLNF